MEDYGTPNTAAEREHERAMAKIKADDRDSRRDAILMGLAIVVAALLLAGLGAWIATSSTASAENYQAYKVACAESGGVMWPGKDGTGATCVTFEPKAVD